MGAGCRPWSRKVGLAIVMSHGAWDGMIAIPWCESLGKVETMSSRLLTETWCDRGIQGNDSHGFLSIMPHFDLPGALGEHSGECDLHTPRWRAVKAQVRPVQPAIGADPSPPA
jgi:hypothetical protein